MHLVLGRVITTSRLPRLLILYNLPLQATVFAAFHPEILIHQKKNLNPLPQYRLKSLYASTMGGQIDIEGLLKKMTLEEKVGS